MANMCSLIVNYQRNATNNPTLAHLKFNTITEKSKYINKFCAYRIINYILIVDLGVSRLFRVDEALGTHINVKIC